MKGSRQRALVFSPKHPMTVPPFLEGSPVARTSLVRALLPALGAPHQRRPSRQNAERQFWRCRAHAPTPRHLGGLGTSRSRNL